MGVLEYFRSSPAFSQSRAMSSGDAALLYVIQEGLAASRFPEQQRSDANNTEVGKWRDFFGAQGDPRTKGNVPYLKQLWGTAGLYTTDNRSLPMHRALAGQSNAWEK